jgi:Undecaprenyl-phosphate galactose phosphotransferase WbaP
MPKNKQSAQKGKNGDAIIYQDDDFYSKKQGSLFWKHRRWTMSFFMLSSDLLCLIVSTAMALAIWSQVRKDFLPERYAAILIPVAACLIVVYFLIDLYPALGVGPVEELRRLTIGSFLIVLGLAALSFYLGNANSWSRAILGLSWLFITVSIPLSRKVFRRLAVKWDLWGMPVAVIGDTVNARAVYNKLRQRPLTGFWPVICVGAQVLPGVAGPINQSLFKGIDIAIIPFGESSLADAKNILLNKSHTFQRIIVVLDEQGVGPLWVTPLHLVEYLGLEVTHNLLDPFQKALKRLFDLTLILLSAPFWVPFTIVVALLIKLDSAGPVFYSQTRIGYDGKEIKIWKFRSMTSNAKEELEILLHQDPPSKMEWEQNFKLKKDPRVTRFGHILRRTSLDEFPQIWNILRGEMSVIGPRPIVQDEISLYGKEFEIYRQVLPGLTGMWQISGRNDLPYRERVNLDVYYVQNWSVWLDIHILMHSVITVLEGKGAY